jgi:hypothetical protein
MTSVVLDSLTADDRAQLQELYARSVVLLEFGRCKEWVTLFEPQAVLRCVQSASGPHVEYQFRGHEELRQVGERITRRQFDVAVGQPPPAGRLRHMISDVCLFREGTGHALGIAQVAVLLIGGGAPRWYATGTYADRFTRCLSGCWRFASRCFTADGVAAVVPANALRQASS